MARAVTASAAAAAVALLILALVAAATPALAQSRGGGKSIITETSRSSSAGGSRTFGLVQSSHIGGNQKDKFFHDHGGWYHWDDHFGGHGHGGGNGGHKKKPPPGTHTFEPTPSPKASPPPEPPQSPPPSPPLPPPPSPPPPKPQSPPPPSPPPPANVCPRRDEYVNKNGKCKKCRSAPVQVGGFTCYNLESLLSTSKKCVPTSIPAFYRRPKPGGRRRLSQAASIATCISATDPTFDVVLAAQSAQQPALQGSEPEFVKNSLRLAGSIVPKAVTPAAGGNAVASFANNGRLNSYRGGVVLLTGVVIVVIDGSSVYVCFQSFLRVCR